ncbi:MAG: hypothetical protein J3K34DRAFT_156562 [Monoraphidium minutum]|nr:MAG: hypothetical protein J3K34DRAFT_156562 [Monoraphidium minutum]
MQVGSGENGIEVKGSIQRRSSGQRLPCSESGWGGGARRSGLLPCSAPPAVEQKVRHLMGGYLRCGLGLLAPRCIVIKALHLAAAAARHCCSRRWRTAGGLRACLCYCCCCCRRFLRAAARAWLRRSASRGLHCRRRPTRTLHRRGARRLRRRAGGLLCRRVTRRAGLTLARTRAAAAGSAAAIGRAAAAAAGGAAAHGGAAALLVVAGRKHDGVVIHRALAAGVGSRRRGQAQAACARARVQ